MKYLLTTGMLCLPFFLFSQTAAKNVPDEIPAKSFFNKDLRINLNESGSQYFRFVFLNQTWVRLNESNPGTTVFGNPKNQTLDFGLRRTRIQMYGQVTDRVFLYMQFGMNNFNRTAAYQANAPAGITQNRKIAAFFHDAVGEYDLWRRGEQFVRIGGGLTVVNGLSRFSQPSVGSIMTTDVPVFAQATVDQIDQFDRKLSIYSRGQVGKFNYRVGVADMFPIETNGAATAGISEHSVFTSSRLAKSFQGMLIYNFWDTEDNTTPGYMTGTYLGKRRVLNLEAGVISQKNATWRKAGADTVYHDMLLWSVAAFLDKPIRESNGAALSAYFGYYGTSYGKGYLRFNGIMNPATGTGKPLAGAGGTHGNAFPMFGNGSVVYTQAGYKFRDDLLGSQGTLMPYVSWQSADYDRISGRMNVWNAGLNWLVNGHKGKWSLNYESRPYFANEAGDGPSLQKKGRKSAVVLQYQISI
ncbi:hypothetical protein GCM10023091_14820 [Ravibacter arvi]|uniref:Porin n=1 Tax=Ravibacter arvi TaxID=2051041 RepID=A0ABP8LV12_9BACT